MKPTPIPGPMVPRPAPTPSAIALPALRPIASLSVAAEARWVMTDRSTLELLYGSVLLGDRAAEVDGRQGGEDEGLQRGDQAHFEQEERDRHRTGDQAEHDRAH